ncbi:hypothetical protein LMG29542_01230 [Paraburkholderia humisilvae]|uniref:Uncharacterized protein n=1 Tax=Paraburkholderia humisilvae TaxID=627669 RepID=A0A6J5D7R8_9BURK|nr:hypothetical protein LMG29542_01230 [Paraburkholderia humisilvae]
MVQVCLAASRAGSCIAFEGRRFRAALALKGVT